MNRERFINQEKSIVGVGRGDLFVSIVSYRPAGDSCRYLYLLEEHLPTENTVSCAHAGSGLLVVSPTSLS